MANRTHLLPQLVRWSAVLAGCALLAGCGGSSGGDDSPGPAPDHVIVSGTITFDRVPFDTPVGTGLDPSSPIVSPARGVVVEAISGASAIATTITDETGAYSLEVPSNTQIFIRAKAQMLKSGAAPTWNFRVLNNTNSDALYALDSGAFNTGTADSTRDLRAASGWTGTSYGQTRAAAPFAILDTVYGAVTLIHSASPSAAFDPLNLFWSPTNRPTTPNLCIDAGEITTTFYTRGGGNDDCGQPFLEGIYILGDVATDTDEFDQHVIAHEFGHYVEAQFSRSDSIGGDHGAQDKLDLRVAFGEGWGNAFGAMVLGDPVYRDSFTFNGGFRDAGFDLEQDDSRSEGWFSEASVGEILWDLFDDTNEPGDNLSLGFGPLFAAMTNGQRTTPALTSIFSFLAALRAEVPADSAAINQLRAAEQIAGTDEFGASETNDGGDFSVLPIFKPIVLNQPQQSVCVSPTNGLMNKLGNNKFFRLDLPSSALVTITVIGAADALTPGSQPALNPEIFLYERGGVVASAVGVGASDAITQVQLAAPTYIIEVFDDQLGGSSPRCMTISVTGS